MPVRRSLLAGPVLDVAPKLLGMVLRSTTDEGTVAVRLTEVEAYDGPNDPGSHAYRGETPRNAVMFGPPGFLYVYFTYGMHYCMNVVVGPEGRPSAVLLRAGEIIEGLDLARARRGQPDTQKVVVNQARAGVRAGPVVKRPNGNPDRDLARGPARLCVALAGPGFDGQPATGPRVGLREAADWAWRFWIPGDPTVSPYRPHVPKRRA